MDTPAISHHGPGQTDPEIYADHVRYRFGLANAGSYLQWAILIGIEGAGLYASDSDEFTVATGDLIIVRPRTWNSWRVTGVRDGHQTRAADVGWEVAYASFHPYPHWITWLDAFAYENGIARMCLAGQVRQAVLDAMLHVAAVFRGGGIMRDEWTMHALQNAILTLSCGTIRKKTSGNTRIDNALEILHGSYSDAVSLSDVARRVGVSGPHFSTLFTSVVGLPPVQYLEQIRLGHAAEMLRYSHMTVTEIARATGYADPFYFARRFRGRFRQTPTEYRAAGRLLRNEES